MWGESAGIAITGLIAGSVVEEWLAAHPDDPAAADLRAGNETSKRRYLTTYRPLLGWAIFVGRRQPGLTT